MKIKPLPYVAAAALLSLLPFSFLMAADSGWPRASLSEAGLDPAPLERLEETIRAQPEINIHGVLIVRRGKLAWERYFSGRDEDWGSDLGVVEFGPDTRHDLRSVSKSVTSALVGIAVAEGRIPGVGANALELFPAYREQLAPDKRALTLEHILTMSAGLDWFEPPDYSNPGNDEIRMIGSPDPVAFTLGRSFSRPPGAAFQYNGGLPTLLGYLLEEAYGQRGDAIAREKLFEPLGIADFDFRANDSGMLAYASGLRLRPRDMAKIGQLYLGKGRWNGRQVLDRGWVEASLAPQYATGWQTGYGYQWWIPVFSDGTQRWQVPAAVGNGGQRIFVVEPLDMVVVVTAGNYNLAEVPLSGMRVLSEYVFPAAGHVGMERVPYEP